MIKFYPTKRKLPIEDNKINTSEDRALFLLILFSIFRYHDDDDDLRSMEVGYSQIQKEEARRYVLFT